ncbi:uncharacterized protein LOC108451170 [Gossypium arboreum]|uniref:uncharacterized protein LOC108451170 n=1 Tax=Gossypium arboreum TaxID=29729 RepID=UPI0008192580|nr:uncharacterized protein LOC108451170 [Gossypium arboreum]
MAPYEAFYGRKYRSPLCWTEVGERKLIGLELVTETEDKIRLIQERLKAGSDRQKSYADLKRKDIEFNVGDFVFLKYQSDPSHIVPVEEIEVRPDLSFEEELVQILERETKVLR